MSKLINSVRHYAVAAALPLWRLFNPQFTPKFTRDQEVEFLINLARPTTGTLLEIGCNEGATTKALAEAFPTRRVIGIDWTGSGVVPFQQRHEKPRIGRIGCMAMHLPNVTILDMDSRYAADADEMRKETIGFMFIDGDHTLAGVSRDTSTAINLVKPGGVIAWHDYAKDQPYFIKVHAYLQTLIASGWPIVGVEPLNIAFMPVYASATNVHILPTQSTAQ